MATAIPLPSSYDAAPESSCSDCDELRRELAKARNLLRAIARTEAKPAKREELDEDPRDLRIIGYETTLAAIKMRCMLFLDDSRRSA